MEEKALTSNVMMIRPHNFGFNEQTAKTNKFQKKTNSSVNLQALKEFNNAVETLRMSGINVFVFDDLKEVDTPDSIFPNNWISFHEDGTAVVYPMLALNRRNERRADIIQSLSTLYGFSCSKVIDLTNYEKKNKFLEGTGSLVLDHENKIAYACLSERTNEEVLNKFCSEMKYRPVKFHAFDETGFPIYHTNVMMALGGKFAIVCLDSIKDEDEKKAVVSTIKESGKNLIELTFKQMLNFAGNALELLDSAGNKKLIISKRALGSLSKEQKDEIEKYCDIISIDVSTIEECGGGSIRCMLAEIFLPQKKGIKTTAKSPFKKGRLKLR
ncbi:MAG: arginine deiminase-related protein [Candidatus Parvarchaeota archaeon]|nr:arginine deiminase-related protein [Candidatus Parvarchaeum tengchongense]